MRRTKYYISAPAALFLALLWFLDDTGLASALIPAVAAHEAGHALAVRLTWGRVTELRLTLFGARMLCTPAKNDAHLLLRMLAGPLAGLVFAFAASYAGRRLDSAFLFCAGGISIVLTLFNLLPHPELDGGRALFILLGSGRDARETVALLGMISSAALLVWGLLLAKQGYGHAMTAAGIALLLAGIARRLADIPTCEKRRAVVE